MRTAPLFVVALLAGTSLSLASPALGAPLGTAAPGTVGNDGTKTITVTASDFYPAAQEEVVLRAAPAIPGQGDLTADVTNASSCSPTALFPNADCGTQLSLSVGTLNAAPGTYDVVETQTDLSTLPSSTRTRVLAVVTVYSQPTIASVSPASRGQGGTSTITVTGTGFAAGLTADFGLGTTATNVRVDSPTSASVDLTVAAGAAPGSRDVTLTSADAASATSNAAFTIAPGPVISSVSPNRLLRGDSVTITVQGSNFVSGDGFALSITGAAVSNVSVTASQLTADVTVPADTPYGPRAVRVRNPDAGAFALDGGFAVLAPPGAPSGLVVATGDGSAVVSWAAPTEHGSSDELSYAVSVSDVSGTTKNVSGTTAGFTGLLNGTAYTFTVTPMNADSPNGTPATVVGTPRYATALTLSVRPTATAGQDVAVAGILKRSKDGSPAAGASLQLRFVPRVGAAFTRTVQTGPDGRFSTTLRAAYTFRVLGVFGGRAEDSPATSLTSTTFVAARVAVVSPKSGAVSAANQTVTVVGSVSPNKQGRVVGCYFGSRLVGKATIATNGSFRIPVRLARGNYRLVVKIGATPGNIASQSPAFIVSRR